MLSVQLMGEPETKENEAMNIAPLPYQIAQGVISPSAVTSDALVFFGATGDLAYKKIFPVLHSMIRHGTLTTPIIGVAKSGWTIEQLRARCVTV